MKNILLLVLAAVLLFSLSAAISLYLNSPRGKPEGEESKKAKNEPKTGNEGEKKSSGSLEGVAPVVAPSKSSSEEVARLLTRVKSREEEVTRREEDARKYEQRLQIVMENLRGERSALESLRKQFNEELKRIEISHQSLGQRAKSLEEDKKTAAKSLAEIQQRLVEFEKGEQVNLERMARWVESTPPDRGAALIKQLADSGQIDTSVKLLSLMQPRQVSRIMAEMSDLQLAAQLMDRTRGLPRRP